MRQNGIFTSSNPGALKITIRKFYRASGASTQLKGVIPDIILPSINNHIEVGEASLENPLQWDTISPAEYEKLNRVQPYLAALRRNSDQRTTTDPDYLWVRQEVERFKKLQAEKSVSLNEALRVKDKKEADERTKARKKELVARPEPAGKIYDLTLKLVDQPGLPPPTLRTNSSVSSTFFLPDGTNPGTALTLTTTKDQGKTNKAGHKGETDEDDISDSDLPPLDITLDEARRILADYIALLNESNGVRSNGSDVNRRPQQTQTGGRQSVRQ
jgi:carboxyl-terminal processing protease